MIDFINNIDSAILLFIQDYIRCPALSAFFTFFTRLGDMGIIWIILGLILLFPKKTRRGGFDTLVCLATSTIFNDFVLKNLVARIRPYEIINSLVLMVPAESSFSFPSGHTSVSFAAATALTFAFGKKGAWAFIPAALMGFSRLYVGVHYPTDVLGGMVVGTAIAALTYCLLGKYLKTDLIRKSNAQ